VQAFSHSRIHPNEFGISTRLLRGVVQRSTLHVFDPSFLVLLRHPSSLGRLVVAVALRRVEAHP